VAGRRSATYGLADYIKQFQSLVNRHDSVAKATMAIYLEGGGVFVNGRIVSASKANALASRAQTLADEWDSLRVDYAAMQVPPPAAQAHKWWLSYVHHQYLGVMADIDFINAGGDAALYKPLLRQMVLTDKAYAQWWYEIRVAAKRLGTSPPWGVAKD
jgi:outer membrane murein-binding lipoprotein Lpp